MTQTVQPELLAVSPANPNLIINGDMRIAQRGTSFTGIAGANTYTLDRWQFKANGLVEGVYSVAQETSVVPAKFSSALKATCTTAEVTAGASYRASLRYSVEGYDASDLDWGSADAQQVTISFKVRSSLIGTYCVALSNGTRTIRKEYTISVADTWEEKTLTFAGDTTGTWAVNNTQGVEVQFALGVGANLNAGTDNTWETNDDIATASQVDWGGTLNATFYLTGVKLEVGNTATAFVPDDYATALAKCRRYYQIIGGAVNAFAYKWYQTTNNYIQQTLTLAAAMRAIPTLTKNGTWNTTNCGQPTFSSAHPGTIWFQSQTTSTGASGLYTDSTDDSVEMDAEL